VKDKHCLSKPDGIHRAVGAADIGFHHFKHPRTPKALERFGGIVLVNRSGKSDTWLMFMRFKF
jgi:hypothetical protein